MALLRTPLCGRTLVCTKLLSDGTLLRNVLVSARDIELHSRHLCPRSTADGIEGIEGSRGWGGG